MTKTQLFSAFCLLLGLTGGVQAAPESLSAELEPLRPYIGKTWRGLLSEPGKPEKIDISHWERALNGTAVKIRHSVNQGEYGGETIVFFDKKLNQLRYYYFTTAGFYTHGTMQIDVKTGLLAAEEQVENNANGITAVRSTSTLGAGQLKISSEYLQHGKWVTGHSATYTEAPDAKVQFK
ncbi:MAG: hypothetical protein U5L02_00965 [Rheinheimera sp.]|nr:hypothetical protein [Rheinheimera sp.]